VARAGSAKGRRGTGEAQAREVHLKRVVAIVALAVALSGCKAKGEMEQLCHVDPSTPPANVSASEFLKLDADLQLRLSIAAAAQSFSSKTGKEAAGALASPSLDPAQRLTILHAAMSESGYGG